jgi:RNA polymerase sigma-70 factor, ECF subfamily
MRTALYSDMMVTLKPQTTHVTDADLVDRICAGDETAFFGFYKRYAQYVAGVAFRLLANAGEVDDVVQDTFVTASQKLTKLKEPEHVRLWLVKIAVRHAQKRLRSRRRIQHIGDMTGFGGPSETDTKLASMLDDLRDVLQRIPSRIGEPWILHRLEGLTIREVAEVCDISVATIKRRVAAADRKVQQRIDIYV